MRVVAGRFRGRELVAPPGRATRPITDRAKESLFNILGARLCRPGELPECHVLDVFAGTNRGLVLAEVELARADEAVRLPPWVAAEVSTDRRFTNSSLARVPFRTWLASLRRRVTAAQRGGGTRIRASD